jgi:hypothetical protein
MTTTHAGHPLLRGLVEEPSKTRYLHDSGTVEANTPAEGAVTRHLDTADATITGRTTR